MHGVDQRKIAQILGVSQASVSRALSGHPNVSASLKTRVQELCRTLGYEPNFMAQGLSRQRTHTISVIINIRDKLFLSDLHSRWVGALQKEAYAQGYAFRLDPLIELAKVIGQRAADGYVVFGASRYLQSEQLAKVTETTSPVVFTDCDSKETASRTVRMDNVGGGRVAAQHLISLGHTRIAYFGLIASPPTNVSHDRYDGFLSALGANGLETSPDLMASHLTWPEEVDEVIQYEGDIERLLRLGATAIFCSSDTSAIAVIKMLKRRGLLVPGDISVVGYDDGVLAKVWDPPITTVLQDVTSAAKQTLQLIVRGLDDGLCIDNIIVPTPLIVRETTGVRAQARIASTK